MLAQLIRMQQPSVASPDRGYASAPHDAIAANVIYHNDILQHPWDCWMCVFLVSTTMDKSQGNFLFFKIYFLSMYVFCAIFTHARSSLVNKDEPSACSPPLTTSHVIPNCPPALRGRAEGTEDEAGSEHESDEREEDSSDDESRPEGPECVIA